MKKWIFYIALLAPFFLGAQNVVQSADTLIIRFGERITLNYGLSPKPADTAYFPYQILDEDSLTIIADTNKVKANSTYIGNSIQFTAFDSGVFTFPELPVIFNSETLYTKAFQFLSIPTKVDTTQAFFDIKENFAAEWTFSDWLAYNKTIIIVAFLIALVIALLIIFRKKIFPKKKIAEIIAPEPVETFDQWMHKYIQQIKDEEAWKKQDLKPYYSSINYLLRKFLEYNFSIKTLEKTSSEIIAQLRHSNINQEDKNRIIQSLNLSDMVKFAKENPTYDDNLARLSWIETFIAKHNVKPEEGNNE